MKTDEEINSILSSLLNELEAKPNNEINSFKRGMIAGICLVTGRIEVIEED